MTNGTNPPTAQHILIINDGKPGHSNQSYGLAEALARNLDASGTTVNLHEVAPLTRAAATKACLTRRWPKNWPDANFVIGTGSGTHLSLLAAKTTRKPTKTDSFTIVICRPMFPTCWFDACVIPSHDQPSSEANNIFITQGAINRIIPSNLQRHDRGLMLIGGLSKHYDWDSERILKDLRNVVALTPQTRWHVTDSRRTPKAVSKQLATIEGIHFTPWANTDSQWVPEQLSQASTTWVTPDSVSMVYEALSSGSMVYVFDLADRQTRVSRGITLLRESRVGYLDKSTHKTAEITPPTAKTPLWEAERIAKAIIQRRAEHPR